MQYLEAGGYFKVERLSLRQSPNRWMDEICKPPNKALLTTASLAALSLVEKLKHWLSWEKLSNKWYSKLRRYKTQKKRPYVGSNHQPFVNLRNLFNHTTYYLPLSYFNNTRVSMKSDRYLIPISNWGLPSASILYFLSISTCNFSARVCPTEVQRITYTNASTNQLCTVRVVAATNQV